MQLPALCNVSDVISHVPTQKTYSYSPQDWRDWPSLPFPSLHQWNKLQEQNLFATMPFTLHMPKVRYHVLAKYVFSNLPLNGIPKHPVHLGWRHISFYVSAELPNNNKKNSISFHDEIKGKKPQTYLNYKLTLLKAEEIFHLFFYHKYKSNSKQKDLKIPKLLQAFPRYTGLKLC